MNARIVVRALLLARPALVTVVPVGQVVLGILPLGMPLPAIGVTHVSSLEYSVLSGGASVKVFSRIQVTVAAVTLKDADAILKQARAALRNRTGSFSGLPGITSVRLDTQGPEMEHEAGFIILTQDVRVAFTDA